jgi:hypothetical protein
VLTLAASTPTYREPASPEELSLLDMLSRGDVRVESIAALLQGVATEKVGHRYRLGYLLGVAVREGRLTDAVAVEAIREGGCLVASSSEAGTCGRLASHFRAAAGEQQARREARSPATVNAAVTRARERLLKAVAERPYGNSGFQLEYATALIEQSPSPLATALVYMQVKSAEELQDPSDQEVFRAVCRVSSRVEDRSETNAALFASGFAAAFRGRIESAEGDAEIVEEVRAIPTELLAAARAPDWNNAGGLFADGVVGCVIDAWRAHPEPPDRWLAWKEQLACQGW